LKPKKTRFLRMLFSFQRSEPPARSGPPGRRERASYSLPSAVSRSSNLVEPRPIFRSDLPGRRDKLNDSRFLVNTISSLVIKKDSWYLILTAVAKNGMPTENRDKGVRSGNFSVIRGRRGGFSWPRSYTEEVIDGRC